MTIQEFSREKELLYVGREEGREEGLKQGRRLQKQVFKMLRQNNSDSEILSELDLSAPELDAYKQDYAEIFDLA